MRRSRSLPDTPALTDVHAAPPEIANFSAGKPAKVFDAKYAESFPARQYDVSPDGQRFLRLKDSPASDQNATPASMVVVQHWTEELKRLVPTR